MLEAALRLTGSEQEEQEEEGEEKGDTKAAKVGFGGSREFEGGQDPESDIPSDYYQHHHPITAGPAQRSCRAPSQTATAPSEFPPGCQTCWKRYRRDWGQGGQGEGSALVPVQGGRGCPEPRVGPSQPSSSWSSWSCGGGSWRRPRSGPSAATTWRGPSCCCAGPKASRGSSGPPVGGSPWTLPR